MTSLVAYKALLAVTLVVSGAFSGGTTYYFDQRTTDLNSRMVSLNEQLNSSTAQTAKFPASITKSTL